MGTNSVHPEASGFRRRKMKRWTILVICAALFLAGLGQAHPPKGKSVRTDSVKVKPQNLPKPAKPNQKDEIILDEIEIKGEVEKPSVIILPKRLEPEMKEVELERSFTQEVKEGAGDVPKPDKTIGQVEPVKSIKKAVEKKRD
jgi:hypothetical protein